MEAFNDRPILQNAVWPPVTVESNALNMITYGAAATQHHNQRPVA